MARRHDGRPLTARQQAFVDNYVIDLNATRAAIRAGYSKKTARQAGAENLSKPVISAEIASAKKKLLARAQLSADRVLEELRRIAFSNACDFFDAKGNLKPVSKLSEEQGSVLERYDVVIANATAGDGHQDTIAKIRFWDKLEALNQLMKYFGLYKEKIEHTGDVTCRWLSEQP